MQTVALLSSNNGFKCGPSSQSWLQLAAPLSPLSEQITLMVIIRRTDGANYEYSSVILHSEDPVHVLSCISELQLFPRLVIPADSPNVSK